MGVERTGFTNMDLWARGDDRKGSSSTMRHRQWNGKGTASIQDHLTSRLYERFETAGVDAVEYRVAPLDVRIVQHGHRAESHRTSIKHLMGKKRKGQNKIRYVCMGQAG